MSGRVVHEQRDTDGDRLRIIACRAGGHTVGVATRWHADTTGVTAGVYYPTPGALAGLQDALADITCPDSLRDPAVLLASIEAVGDDLRRLETAGTDPALAAGELLRHAPAIAEAERLIGRAVEQVKAAWRAAGEQEVTGA